jgi:hypothetical protein
VKNNWPHILPRCRVDDGGNIPWPGMKRKIRPIEKAHILGRQLLLAEGGDFSVPATHDKKRNIVGHISQQLWKSIIK